MKNEMKLIVLNDQGGARMNVTYNMTGTLRAQMYGRPPLVFDARGNGGGKIAPTITGDHNAHISNYTAIVVTDEDICGEEIFRMA